MNNYQKNIELIFPSNKVSIQEENQTGKLDKIKISQESSINPKFKYCKNMKIVNNFPMKSICNK